MAEIELKLAVPTGALELLRQRLQQLGHAQVQRVDSTYFDTPDGLLARKHAALRVRRLGRRWVQTFKTGDAQAALSTRGEWEVPAPRGKLDVQRFPLAALRALAKVGLKVAPSSPLAAVYGTRFQRSAWLVSRAAASIEVALDEGEIVAGAARLPLQELELELKQGEPAALFDLALELMAPPKAEVLALLPLGESKAARGVRLAAGTPVQAVKAQARRITEGLKPGDRAGVALRKVLGNGVDVLLANAHGVLAGDDPEFVHQARVALRRMRSALRLLAGDTEVPDALVSELRWIAGALGPARDADVLLAETLPPWLAQLPQSLEAEAADLRQAAVRSQLAARGEARAALRSARFALFALRLLQWAASPVDTADERSLRQLAPRRLRKAQSRMLEQARFFAALEPSERHRVRILAKRLRYALDLFACALPARATRSHGAALARLQDQLGALNDMAVAASILPRLTSAPQLLAAAHAWFDGSQAERLRHVVEAEAALLALARQPEPWRKG